MADKYCLGFMVDPKTNERHPVECKHPAWKMLIVGIPGVFGDFGWECTKCGEILQGRNPFKESEKVNKEEFHE